MNHQPFEDWLLSGDQLSAAQRHDLHDHLNACDYCTALAEVNTALRATRPASRFEARLQLQEARQRRRTLWGVFFLALASMGVIVALALRVIPYFGDDLLGVAVAWIPYLVSLFNSANVIGEIVAVLIGIVAGFIPAYAWALAALLTALFGWLWVVSISRFARLPQGA